MKKIANALVCFTLLGAAAAHAEGLSVGGSLASSRWKGDDIGGASTDRSATGFKLYGGYEFAPNLSLEAGYADLGKFKTRQQVEQHLTAGAPRVLLSHPLERDRKSVV